MRSATKGERDSVDKYIKSISVPIITLTQEQFEKVRKEIIELELRKVDNKIRDHKDSFISNKLMEDLIEDIKNG